MRTQGQNFHIFTLRPGFKKVCLQDPFGRSAKKMQNTYIYTEVFPRGWTLSNKRTHGHVWEWSWWVQLHSHTSVIVTYDLVNPPCQASSYGRETSVEPVSVLWINKCGSAVTTSVTSKASVTSELEFISLKEELRTTLRAFLDRKDGFTFILTGSYYWSDWLEFSRDQPLWWFWHVRLILSSSWG